MWNKVFLLSYYLFLNSFILNVSAKKELKLLNVLSVNKFYVPDYDYASPHFQLPKNLTYKYFVNNAMDIPNSVKMDLFNLGVYLRQTYDRFLGSLYLSEFSKMRTMEFPVSIIAGELINAGLWPPVGQQIWNESLLWQPIPFDYFPVEEDTVLLGTLCPAFEEETFKVLEDYKLSDAEAELLKKISEAGQVRVTNPIEALLFYLTLQNSTELNQTHSSWIEEIVSKQSLLNISLSAYNLLSKTNVQKYLNGGSFIKKIINDYRDYANGTLSSDRKINIYSGDDRNLAGILKNLNIPLHDLPESGAALIFELYVENNVYFIKINYFTGSSNETIPYALNDCDLFCPIENFSHLVAHVLPEDELTLCHSTNSEGSGGVSLKEFSIVYTLLMTLFVIISSTRNGNLFW